MNSTKLIIGILIIVVIILLIGLLLPKILNKEEKIMNTIVVIETSKGNIELELFDTNAPNTVKNFLEYVNTGFYENTVFHRVIKGFMVQGGGFIEDGSQKDVLDAIDLESTNITNLKNETGTVAMARTNDPNSATAQFFVNVTNNSFLDYSAPNNPGYAVFGKVISGMEIVTAIENVETTTKYQHYQDWPVEDIIIKKVYIKK